MSHNHLSKMILVINYNELQGAIVDLDITVVMPSGILQWTVSALITQLNSPEGVREK